MGEARKSRDETDPGRKGVEPAGRLSVSPEASEFLVIQQAARDMEEWREESSLDAESPRPSLTPCLSQQKTGK